AAQSIGESGTKLTLHSEARISQASDVNNIQINHSGIVKFDDLKVVKQQNNVENTTFITITSLGRLYIINKKGAICERHQVPYGAILTIVAGEEVEVGQRIAHWDQHTFPIISEYSGYIRFIDAFEGGNLERNIDRKTGIHTLLIKNHKLWSADRRDSRPRINIVDKLDKNNLLQQTYCLPSNTTIYVEDGDSINMGEIIAKTPKMRDSDVTNGLLRIIELFEARVPKEPSILATASGKVIFCRDTKTKYCICIMLPDGSRYQVLIPKWRSIQVIEGQDVERGDILVEGQPNPHDILHLNGINALVTYLIHECQEIYLNHGISINDKHFEVIIRQMLRTVLIIAHGDTSFCDYEIVTRQKLLDENERLSKNLSHLKTLARWKPKLLGITKASLAT
ncbi:MAG: DNA-directed RNA polymerase subunit beta', partial [Thiomargarita sp.]|nr:DNA-directed RNA polymerase subunit beta' [Thiomargarita sp.]